MAFYIWLANFSSWISEAYYTAKDRHAKKTGRLSMDLFLLYQGIQRVFDIANFVSICFFLRYAYLFCGALLS